MYYWEQYEPFCIKEINAIHSYGSLQVHDLLKLTFVFLCYYAMSICVYNV